MAKDKPYTFKVRVGEEIVRRVEMLKLIHNLPAAPLWRLGIMALSRDAGIDKEPPEELLKKK